MLGLPGADRLLKGIQDRLDSVVMEGENEWAQEVTSQSEGLRSASEANFSLDLPS